MQKKLLVVSFYMMMSCVVQGADLGTGAYTMHGWQTGNAGNGNDLDWLRSIGKQFANHFKERMIPAYQRWSMQDEATCDAKEDCLVRSKLYEIKEQDLLARQYIDMKAQLSYLRLHDMAQGDENLFNYGCQQIAQAQCNQLRNLSKVYEVYLQDNQLEKEELELRKRMKSKASYGGYRSLVELRRKILAAQKKQAGASSLLQNSATLVSNDIKAFAITGQDGARKQDRSRVLNVAGFPCRCIAPFPAIPYKRSRLESLELQENVPSMNSAEVLEEISKLSSQELLRRILQEEGATCEVQPLMPVRLRSKRTKLNTATQDFQGPVASASVALFKNIQKFVDMQAIAAPIDQKKLTTVDEVAQRLAAQRFVDVQAIAAPIDQQKLTTVDEVAQRLALS